MRAVAFLTLFAVLSVAPACRSVVIGAGPRYLDAKQPTSQRVDDLLGRMTLPEKVGQMDQVLIDNVTTPAQTSACAGCFGDPDPASMSSVLIDSHVGSLLAGATDMPVGNSGRNWAITYNEVQAYTVQQSRLHIPALFGIDAVHGFSHPVDAPLFPHGIGMGATWDTAAAEREGSVTGHALRSTGWLEDFAPVQDVYRDSRWGRAYEPWSEEPTLAGALGAAEVRGLQGDSNQPQVAATIKHLAGNSESINGHDRVEGQLSTRYLQDVFLPAYSEGIAAGARMVMISSSSINGIPATGSAFLQTTLLRQRLHFDGVTISDYKDVQALETVYHAAPDMAGAIALAVNAGLDMAMWVDTPDMWQSNMLADVDSGRIPPSRVDQAVRRILTLKFDLGLFDEPCVVDPSQPCVDPDGAATTVEDGRDATLQCARESITLLKNTNDLLPLPIGTRLVVTGPNADSMAGQLGGWSVSWQGVPPGMDPPGTTVRQGLAAADPSVVFAAPPDDAVNAAADADVIVAVIGEQGYAEGLGDNPAPELPRDQQTLLTALESTGKPVVVVVMAGRPLDLGTGNEQNAGAILMAYQGSTEAGKAVADAIYGAINPSGKLSVSWPVDSDQPKFFDQLPSTSAGRGSTYNPMFTFGFGLSYTTFSVADLSVSTSDGLVSVNFTVTNTGSRAGADIVPVFVAGTASPVVVPPHRLVGFARIDLAAGESRSVSVQWPMSRLAVTPGDMESSAAPEVVAGDYTLEVPTAPTPADLFPITSPPLRAELSLD